MTHVRTEFKRHLFTPFHLAPLALLDIITEYGAPNDYHAGYLKWEINEFSQNRIEADHLGQAILNAFSYEDSRVAFVWDDPELSPVREHAFASPKFPIALKLYYLNREEFICEITKNPALGDALLHGLLVLKPPVIPANSATEAKQSSPLFPLDDVLQNYQQTIGWLMQCKGTV